MKVNTLITNCPNCGGELTEEGFCNYCNTKVRLANKVEVDISSFLNSKVEIELKVKQGDKTVIIPFTGMLTSYDILYDPVFCEIGNHHRCIGNNDPRVTLTFEGHVMKN